MGMFLSATGIIGKTQTEVASSLNNYAKSAGGGAEQGMLTMDDDNCCVIEESNGNCTILYPYGYLEWDKSSEFISRELGVPAFSFHIHDGDLWMYILYVNGDEIDQFNPIPDYWEDGIEENEIEYWKGNAKLVSSYLNIDPKKIENYLHRWDLDEEEPSKAYPDDLYNNEDWQLLDFMRKISLPYPLDDNNKPKGQTYKLWTNQLRLK
jgi:hypothetical protein